MEGAETMSKVTITIEMEKLPSGVISTKTGIDGENFHYYEILGALEIVKHDLIAQSTTTAQEIIEKEGKDA